MEETKNIEPNEMTEINKIFKTLMHFPGSTFSDLWDKSIESNKFTYYLKKIENDGFIEKREGRYYLTLKGKSEVATISGDTGKSMKRPYVALLLVPRREGKYILYHRMKEPYYGHCGFPGAKLEMGEEILAGAERELLEETGLRGKGKIVAVQNAITLNDDEVFAHMTQFIVLFEEPKGELVTENREGTYKWATKNEILSQKNLFPDIPNVIKLIEKKEFALIESKFIQEKEKFVGIKTKNIPH